MISLDLFEKKLSQLNQQHVSKVKDLEKAMHSQGIDPGEPKRDAHHVQYPKATFRKTGKPAHGITAVDDGKGKLTSSTGGNTVRDAGLKSGRVDKRPAAKAKRKEEAAENKAAKKKNRDPFTREHTEWWVEMWRLDEGEQENARRRAQMARGDKLAAPASSAIVKVPGSERTQKETSGIARKSGPGVRVPKKETEAPKPAGQSKPMNKPTMQSRPVKSPEEERSKAKAKVDQRKDGKLGGVKRALGGDVIGMRGKKGENALQKQERQKMNKKAQGDFVSKKVQQTGNLAKDLAGRAVNSGEQSDPAATSAASVQGTGKAKSWATK